MLRLERATFPSNARVIVCVVPAFAGVFAVATVVVIRVVAPWRGGVDWASPLTWLLAAFAAFSCVLVAASVSVVRRWRRYGSSTLEVSRWPDGESATEMSSKYVRWGSSPRGAQAVTLAAKVQALLDGRFNVSFEDVRKVALPALRHRILLNFEGEAENLNPDAVVEDILEKTPTLAEAAA